MPSTCPATSIINLFLLSSQCAVRDDLSKIVGLAIIHIEGALLTVQNGIQDAPARGVATLAPTLHPPPIPLASCLRAFFWRDLALASKDAHETRIPPSAYPGIVWFTRGSGVLKECGGVATSQVMPSITLSGAHRFPYLSESSQGGDSFCLAFQPGALALLTGSDLGLLVDEIADAQIWLPADWSKFLAEVHKAPNHYARMEICRGFLEPRWASLASHHATWLRLLHAGWRRDARQAAVAELGWTMRHFQRRTRQLVGLRPGEIERMLRAEHALLDIRDANLEPLDVASCLGYADQSHFTKEARAVFGRPPGALKHHVLYEHSDADWLLRRYLPQTSISAV